MASAHHTSEPELFAPLHVIVVESPIGKLWVESDGELITQVSFKALRSSQARTPGLLLDAGKQLVAYFSRKRKRFELPVQHSGTRFQRMVMESLMDVPFGRTVTYQAVAARIGGKAAARTVGQACISNHTPILVPCHRVVGGNGLLSDYVGGLWRKRWLLQHEASLPDRTSER